MSYDLDLTGFFQILLLSNTTLSSRVTAKAEENVLLSQSEGMVSTANDLDDTVFLKCCDALGLLLSL